MQMNALIPELDVADLDRSLQFYLEVIGCELQYQRTEERFVFLGLEGAQLMLEEAAGPGRRFRTAQLEYPYGRGINLQIRVADVNSLYERSCASGFPIIIPLEEQWYRRDALEVGNRQFVISDPDGYLLRFFTDLGSRQSQVC